MDKIQIWCDGGCRGNQNKENIGAWGVVLKYKNNTKELNGATINTTNNKMELQACIEGLKAILNRALPVEVVLDSNYVLKGITEWIHNWIKKGWKTSQKKPVENKELWQELYELKNQFANIEFVKCKGHTNNEGNIRADELCNIAMDTIVVRS